MAETKNGTLFPGTTHFKRLMSFKCHKCELLFAIFTDASGFSGNNHKLRCPYCETQVIEFDYLQENPNYGIVCEDAVDGKLCSPLDKQRLDEWHKNILGVGKRD